MQQAVFEYFLPLEKLLGCNDQGIIIHVFDMYSSALQRVFAFCDA